MHFLAQQSLVAYGLLIHKVTT